MYYDDNGVIVVGAVTADATFELLLESNASNGN